MAVKTAVAAVAPKKRKKKPKLPWPFVLEPIDASILCIDPGSVSGWCIYRGGKPVLFGHVDVFANPGEIDRVFGELKAQPGPHMVVCERPFGAQRGLGAAATSSTGAGAVIWRKATERHRLLKTFVRVYPSQWRSKALGKGWGSAKREVVRAEEQRVATAILREIRDVGADIQPDMAAAICMGRWASYAGEVVAKLPKPRKRKERIAA